MAKKKKQTAKGYGNSETRVVHNTWRNDACRKSEIKRSNVVEFNTLTDALAQGYRKCKACRWEKESK